MEKLMGMAPTQGWTQKKNIGSGLPKEMSNEK